MTVGRLSAVDPNSYAKPEDAYVTHVHLDINVDFSKRVLSGFAELIVKKTRETVDEIVLDSRDVTIHSIRLKDGVELHYTLGEPVLSFGSKLTVKLPEECENELTIVINYTTSPTCTALEWLEPEQTAGKTHPYLFSQCEAIFCRGMIPCQDTPAVKMPYTAKVTTPSALTVLMSAIKGESCPVKGNLTEHHFRQDIPIPSYLIAIAVGAIESRKIGPRSHVWSEKEYVEKAAWEFADTEEILKIAESIVGPYVWGDYDILVLPPSFAFGGMENPCLTFVTPTILCGDRSLVTLIAHEVSHSWTGNLVTNSNFEHFWLNEGFTKFLERKIRARMLGEEDRHFTALDGMKILRDTVEAFGYSSPLTHLVPDLTGVDPDETFSIVPYEKGHTLLFYLEQKLGGAEVFDKFLFAYVEKFKYKSLTTQDFLDFLFEFYKSDVIRSKTLKEIRWEDWLYSPGMPVIIPEFDTTLAKPCISLCKRWVEWDQGKKCPFKEKDLTKLSSNQVIEFLALLMEEDPFPIVKLQKLEKLYKIPSRSNPEIRYRWLRLCIKAKWNEQLPNVVKFLSESGRMKFIHPLYRALYSWEENKQVAVDTFMEHRKSLMLQSATILVKELQLST